MFSRNKKVVPFEPPDSDVLSEMTLEELLEKAESFGRVYVHASPDKRPPDCYSVGIEFDSVPGTSVKAKSEFAMQIHEAFMQAIKRAQLITEQYSGADQ